MGKLRVRKPSSLCLAQFLVYANRTKSHTFKGGEPSCPGGRIVSIGLPIQPVPMDLEALSPKVPSIEFVFRYANVFPRALALMGSGKFDLKPLINRTFELRESIDAFNFAHRLPTRLVKNLVLGLHQTARVVLSRDVAEANISLQRSKKRNATSNQHRDSSDDDSLNETLAQEALNRDSAVNVELAGTFRRQFRNNLRRISRHLFMP
jgi:hypothetical protein